MKSRADFSLYVIIDIDYLLTLKKDPMASLRSALIGGATAVQLRAKYMEDGELLKLAIKMRSVCRKKRIPFIINDRVDVAMAAKSDGVHVGGEDIPFLFVKNLIGNSKIIGVSASDIKSSYKTDRLGADYIGIGPVYATGQKDKKPMGVGTVGMLVKKLKTPVVAIGGINSYNITQLKRAGIRNFSFISAILGGVDIAESTKKIKRLITGQETNK